MYYQAAEIKVASSAAGGKNWGCNTGLGCWGVTDYQIPQQLVVVFLPGCGVVRIWGSAPPKKKM